MPARNRLDRYDEWGQDTWKSPDEESFAAEMGQPSTEPPPHHDVTFPTLSGEGTAKMADMMPRPMATGEPSVVPLPHPHPAVLAQTPVRCNRCDRMAVPFEDTIVLVDGVWMCEGCAGEES